MVEIRKELKKSVNGKLRTERRQLVRRIEITWRCRTSTGKKDEIRPWIGLTNGVLYVGTQEVELERAGEKSAVDGSDPVCSFIHNLEAR